MSIQCYDSTRPNLIPASAPAVLIYADGAFKWTHEDKARFPHARHRAISVLNKPSVAAVLDVELGDATPEDAPGFIKARFGDACIYCNRSTLPAVQRACAGLDYRVWLATLDGSKPTSIRGGGKLAAVQYQGGQKAHFDLSVVYDVSWLRDPPATS